MEQLIHLEKLLEVWKNFASKYDISWRHSFLQWNLPANVSADFALSLALPISHKTKRNPQEIAQEITKLTDYSDLKWTITEKGYINFRFPLSYYQWFLQKTWKQKGQNLRGCQKNICVNFEYISTNPTGNLHLAHFRHAFIGNTLANIYQFSGYKIVREYYINDRGQQITSLINSVYHFYHKLQGSSFNEPINVDYSSKSTEEIAAKLVEKWDKKYLNIKLNEEIFVTWKKEVLEIILTNIRQDLVKCGIKFDIWFSETSLYEKNEHFVLLQELKEKKLIYQQEGATFFRSSLGGDEKDRVIIKQDGDYTYFFSDILYHLNKLQRADKIIDILGADHHGFLARLKSACQLLGYNPETIQIILVQMVNLLAKEGETQRFSKRAGNTIELVEALEHMDMNQLKFFLLEKEPNQPLSINVELLKKKQEKTRLYYLQYAHARCQQITQKAKEKNLTKISSRINLLTQANERKIFNLLIRFSWTLEKIVEENKSHHLIHYLDELAHAWQIYYQNNLILNKENKELTSQRLLLVKNIQIILEAGLNLLGLEALMRM